METVMSGADTRAGTNPTNSQTEGEPKSSRRGEMRPVESARHSEVDARELHPRVYAIVIGLACWLVLSVWIFVGPGVTDYLLFVVSSFIFIAVMLPLILSRVGARDPGKNNAAEKPPSEDTQHEPFRDWAADDFDTSSGKLSGRQATIEVLLPIAAVAFGMTIFGVILLIAKSGVV
jgi:hypothetical protein